MSEFFRFPHTPHLLWLGEGQPRDDKVLAGDEADRILSQEVLVEEKIDGANLGFSVSEDAELLIQNRGSYLKRGFHHEQFRPIWSWLAPREHALIDALWPNLMLFGEWCFAVHSIKYDRLPDWFLGFDVFDRVEQKFWDSERRNHLLEKLDAHPVPRLASGRFSADDLLSLMNSSRVGDAPMEGLVVRSESSGWTLSRAKVVRASFTQSIEEHWSRGRLRKNRLSTQPRWELG